MPVSPHTAQEENNQPDGSSVAEGEAGARKKRKRKSKPTGSRRTHKQKVKESYSKAREDAQLAGVIPVTPEGAVREERVDPHAQGSAALPALVREALRENWATPDSAKPAIVAALLEAFYNDDIVIDGEGNEVHVKPSRRMLMELAKTLRMLDQTQWERDHPEEAGKAKGGASVSLQMNIAAAAVVREAIERGELRGVGAMPSPAQPGALGGSGFAGEVETGNTLDDDK